MDTDIEGATSYVTWAASPCISAVPLTAAAEAVGLLDMMVKGQPDLFRTLLKTIVDSLACPMMSDAFCTKIEFRSPRGIDSHGFNAR